MQVSGVVRFGSPYNEARNSAQSGCQESQPLLKYIGAFCPLNFHTNGDFELSHDLRSVRSRPSKIHQFVNWLWFLEASIASADYLKPCSNKDWKTGKWHSYNLCYLRLFAEAASYTHIPSAYINMRIPWRTNVHTHYASWPAMKNPPNWRLTRRSNYLVRHRFNVQVGQEWDKINPKYASWKRTRVMIFDDHSHVFLICHHFRDIRKWNVHDLDLQNEPRSNVNGNRKLVWDFIFNGNCNVFPVCYHLRHSCSWNTHHVDLDL